MLELFRSTRRSFVWLTEAVLLVAMIFVAADIDVFGTEPSSLLPVVAEALCCVLVTQTALYYAGLYSDDLVREPRKVLASFAKAMAAGLGVALLVRYSLGLSELETDDLIVAFALSTVTLFVWRLAYQRIFSSERFARRALVLGTGELARDVAELLQTRCLGIRFVGFLRRPDAPSEGEDVLGTYDDLVDVVTSQHIDMLILADTEPRGVLPIENVLALKLNGVDVREGTAFYEQATGKIHVRSIKPSALFLTDGFIRKPFARIAKRVFDTVVAAVALVLAAPIMALIAIAIRLESDGPILYRQIRVGERRKEFWMLKFRSMRVDAEKDGARWASVEDDRVTRVGRFLRKTRLDELPQLWNVLRGDMSLVGPRPERPMFVDELERKIPFFSQRLYVRPGVTGHAQVRCSYAASVDDSIEKLQYDLYYIKRFSFWFDVSILLDTVKVVLMRIGSR